MEFNLADLYEIVADAVPDRLALVAGDRRLTYAQLDERANRFAHHLLDHGVEPGDKVGIYSWDRAEWVEAMLGAYKARAVPVNVNYRYVADETRYILDNSDAVVVVHERTFSPLIEAKKQLFAPVGAGIRAYAVEAGARAAPRHQLASHTREKGT